MGTAGRGHRRHRHRENAPALLRWNGDEERCRVDAKVGYDDRGTKRGRAIGRLRSPELLAAVVFPGRVHAAIGAGGNVHSNGWVPVSHLRAALPVGEAVAGVENEGSIVASVVVIANVDAAEEWASGRVVDSYHDAVGEDAGDGELYFSPGSLSYLFVGDALVRTFVGDESIS